MQTNFITKKAKSGYTLVETIIYVGILSIVYFLIVSTLISFNSSYRNVVALRIVDNSAIDAMERMTRDIRLASIIDTGNSTLGTSPGVLTLIATSGGVSTTTKFYVQSGVLKVDVNGSYYGPLTLASATVTSLTFRRLSTTTSEAVKIDMIISGVTGPVTKTKSYHSTIILRGV